MGAARGLPTGWPPGVPPPEAEEFADGAVAWLLDNAPPEFRSHGVFRRQPLALARMVGHYAAGALDASRSAYAGVRRELGDVLPPEAIAEVLGALEHEGVRLARLTRELAMVEEALAGRRWMPKL